MFDGAHYSRVRSDGVELAVVEAGERSRPTIVFVHGYPDTKEMWGPVLERLADDFHVVAYDVRGAGGSSAPRGPLAYSFEHLGADLEAVCDAVSSDRPVHLVGHDWGGIQGWEFASAPRFQGRLASFTTIAGPALGHVIRATRQPLTPAGLLAGLRRTRRSWYVIPLWLPGGPSVVWRMVMSRERWRWVLANVHRLTVDADYPAPSVAADGRHGANLYRRNIPPRIVRPARLDRAHVPVQLIVPSGDRFISETYYDSAEEVAPILWRRTVAGSHWAPRGEPELIARWVDEFVRGIEAARLAPRPRWVRGGGAEQLAGRLALVTGAGSGIGRATAVALAARGANVLLVDRDPAALARATDAIPGSRGFECDVSDPGAMERLAAEVLGSAGVPDVVINNAGIAIAGPFLGTTADQWRRIVDINLIGVATGCRLFGAAMVERGLGGHIVNTASAAAFSPSRSLPAYSATKAAVLMLSECIRGELAPSGIGVTAVCPGLIATNITRATEYVGYSGADRERIGERVSRLYERRNFTPERVAEEIVRAIALDLPVAVVTPEAKLMRALSRLSPSLMRRLAAIDGLPV